ncbi:hypothetical protein B6D60_10280 [candidate division KSB1 bacterium 4484_87]|nr:MAG: hypothetical protein B6D60_10280 [candidate division KSB1 bacterium 4484_87]
MKRRQFIQSMGLMTGGLLLQKDAVLSAAPKKLDTALANAMDESEFWQVVREQFVFPKDYYYFNTGGIGATPSLVMHEVQASTNEQQIHPRPGYDHEKWLEIKESAKKLINNRRKEEIALVGTATEGINIVLNGLPLKKGDEIISSTHEHAALHVPLLHNLHRHGIRVKFFDPDFSDGLGNVDRIEKLITRKTRLLFISHVTCTTGQLFPVKEIGELARAKKLWFALDGAQAVGEVPVDVADLGVDFYAFSGHKWVLGPKRSGIFYVREDLLDTLQPTVVGAYSDGGFNVRTEEFRLNPTAQRYEYATQNEALFHGLGKAIEFVTTIGLERIHQHNRKLAERFYAGLQNIPEVELLSPEEEKYRTSLISFKIKNRNFREVGKYLVGRQFRVRVVPEADLEGIRVSLHVYNNENQVDMLLDEIKKYARK